MGGHRNVPYEELRDARSRRGGFREPDTGTTLARRAESSSSSASSRIVHGRVTYSKISVSVQVIEVTSLSSWQDYLTTKWNEFAWTGFPKIVIVQSGWVGKKAEDFVIVGSLERFLSKR